MPDFKSLGLSGPMLFASGQNPQVSTINKFGRATVGTTLVPIGYAGGTGGIYQTPQSGSATTLRIKAGGNANDTAAGSGAREVTLQGLDETGALVTEAVATAGASASSATTTTFIRLFRAWVSASGTYATSSAGSHSGSITIENGAGGTDWAVIDATVFPFGQSEIAAYSVPLGYTAFLHRFDIQISSTKVVDAVFFTREGILKTAAPYDAMRNKQYYPGITESGFWKEFGHAPLRCPELTDIGFMAKVSTGTSNVSIEFDMTLVKNTA